MNVVANVAAAIPTEEEIIARATAMIPTLRSRIFECQNLGRVPDQTIAEFESAGFFRILQPKLFGGYEMSLLTFYKVLQKLASGCPASGWVMMVLGIHNWEVALLDPQAGRDLWAENDAVRISSSYAPMGGGVKVEGGYQVKGYWRFSSGCDHANWVFLGGFVPGGEDEQPDLRVFLIPRGDYQIIDGTWNVFGLEGSGSKDVEVKGCFVPEYRSHSLLKHFAEQGSDIGLKTFTSPNYRIPFGVAFHNGVASVVAGMAAGMVEVFRQQMQARRDIIMGMPLSVNPAVQRRYQVASTKARQASAMISDVVAGCMEHILKGEDIPMEKRAQYVADAATVGDLASEASVILFRAAGGKGVNNDNLLGVYFRNIQAGANHICMDFDKLVVNAGGVALGMDNEIVVS